MGFASTTSTPRYLQVDGHGDPRYGSRLLPQVVDELAQSNPERIYATIPLSSNLIQGFRDVTMLQISQAVNKCAHWIESTIGRSTVFETLSYMGLPDLRYAIVFLAAVKCGYKLLVPSIRNSTWMNISLLEQTNCTKVMCSAEIQSKVDELQKQKKDLQILTVQSLSDMLQEHSKHYPYEVEFANVQWDPVLVLHSSGSTGPPKPIQTNHATWAVADNDRNLPTVKGRKNQSYALWNFQGSGGRGRYFAAFPPFHLGGFMALVVLPIYSTTATVVLGPADRPPTGHLASEIMKHYDLRALFCPPTIFEQLVMEPEGLEQAKRLDFLLYAGGPLTTATGDLLSQVTDVCQFYGATETSAISALVPKREDWASLEWHPSLRVDMQPSEDDAYEMVLHNDPQRQGVCSLFCNFPDIEEWHTKDLFRPHPTKPNLWRFHGRTDDIIVLSNGSKFNPMPSEAIIAGHKLLSGAVIVGLGRFQPALLVELRDGVDLPSEAVIEDIWPTVQQANAQAPGHGRVIRSMIAVATAKRFERAGKGTVIRKLTAEKFRPEIEALYSEDSALTLSQGHGPVLAETSDLGAIQGYVRACIELSFPMPDLKEDQDLYVLGLDSLKTVEIARILKSGIKSSDTSWLSTQAVYGNPTVEKLSKLIHKSLSPRHLSGDIYNSLEEERVNQMATLVHKYTESLPQVLPRKTQLVDVSKLNVVLTGSTGSLGTQLLRSLVDDPIVNKIHCLNRSDNGRKKQEESFAKLGLEHDLSEVEFIKANYADIHLGLPDVQFNELATTIDIIIHNAWKVDFNHSLETFQPVHIRGVGNLIDWSINSSRHPHIIFLSSTSSVGSWTRLHRNEPVPEIHISDHKMAQKMGYAESKHVAECILNVASEKSQVPVSILRVGQIAGPVSAPGVWSRDEWFPSLIQTSQSLGRLPDYVPHADWIPVDYLAATVLDVVRFAAKTEKTTCTYNIVNPHSTAWTTLLDTVRRRLGPRTEVVELTEWIESLEKLDRNDTKELIVKPAAKILDFYRDLEEQRRMIGGVAAKYSTTDAIAVSETMARLEPVNDGWMETWLTQWGY